MTLIALTMVIIAVGTAVLATCLVLLGGLLKRTADNLDDCAQQIQAISTQSATMRPGLQRINRAGRELARTLPLLRKNAEQLIARSATPVAGLPGMGYLDVRSVTLSPTPPVTRPPGSASIDL